MRDAARVLRPEGDLALLNFSYRDDILADRREFELLCRDHGFALITAGQPPFKSWDGVAFRARRR